jgi:hypothetical protein
MRLGAEASEGAYCYLGGAVMDSGGRIVSSGVVERLPNIRIMDHLCKVPCRCNGVNKEKRRFGLGMQEPGRLKLE